MATSGIGLRFGSPRHSSFAAAALVAAALGALALCAGCGSGGSNNGQVLTALGFFAEPGDTETAPTPTSNVADAGRTVSLSTTISIPNDPDADAAPDLDGGWIGLENALTTGSITTVQALLQYSVTGSPFAIPSVTFPFTVVIPAASSGATPPAGNEVFAQIQLVSAATMDFLRANEGNLPPPPFTMVITTTVTAQSDTGGSFASNPVSYTVTFTP